MASAATAVATREVLRPGEERAIEVDTRAAVLDLDRGAGDGPVLVTLESHAGQPAYYVPKYMADHGYDIIPVPVYYPDVTEILGKSVYRDLTQIPSGIDLLNVFRRSEDIPKHKLEILSKKPKAVWFQLGIRNDEVAEKLAEAGIQVVQDLCLMVEHRALI